MRVTQPKAPPLLLTCDPILDRRDIHTLAAKIIQTRWRSQARCGSMKAISKKKARALRSTACVGTRAGKGSNERSGKHSSTAVACVLASAGSQRCAPWADRLTGRDPPWGAARPLACCTCWAAVSCGPLCA